MAATVIIIFCSLLLMGYIFDLSFSKTKIPSVILLLLLGWAVKQVTNYVGLIIPDVSTMLPILGTIGLVLIVLEGSLELKLNKSKVKMINKSFYGALISVSVLATIFSLIFYFYGNFSFRSSLLNAIPFCLISSAIAISSVGNLKFNEREFIIYESSISDIFGVLLFNFISVNYVMDVQAFISFGFKILIIFVISIISTAGLSLMLSKIDHHVKFIPIILSVILIYTISEFFNLPALIFIMFFGLLIGNFAALRPIKWFSKFHPEELVLQVVKFKELVVEATFLVKSLFFLLFGFLIETSEVLNLQTIIWALIIVVLIFVLRLIQLTISRVPLFPSLFIAPRGLITILLFLSILPVDQIFLVNKSLIIQVIIITALFMMLGFMLTKTETLKNRKP